MLDSQLARVLLPTPQSLAHRTRIASLISPLKRVRPRVPFYDLAAHRIPTLWSLYRGLLREVPGTNIRFRVRMLFRRNHHLTSPAAARKELIKGHKWLDIFVRARDGDEKLRAILLRYDKMIAAKREKERWKEIFRREMAWQAKMRNRPVLTGARFRPSLYHGALPRMKPQPAHITGMIRKRRRTRDRRTEVHSQMYEWRRYLHGEAVFERLMKNATSKDGMRFEQLYLPYIKEWLEPSGLMLEDLDQKFDADKARLLSSFSPDMLAMIKRARREKILYRTRQLERERRGEVLPRTVRRRNKHPPAHVLAKMTEERKRLDKIARHPSEVGFVAMAKMKLGHKLKDPSAWRKEMGSPENVERLDGMEQEIRLTNQRRRQSISEID